MARRFAFYDLDGTLVSSNVVTQYAWYVRRLGSWARFSKLLLSAPVLLGFELYSRRAFNVFFYRFYRGMRRDWLEAQAQGLFEEVFRPNLYPRSRELVASDREDGFEPVLVTGSLDFALGPLAEFFGFDHVISNRLVFENGAATGELEPPLIAETEKVAAMRRLCAERGGEMADSKAYSDSLSDLPMLEAVGLPAAVNPGRRLRRIARERGWPVLDLK